MSGSDAGDFNSVRLMFPFWDLLSSPIGIILSRIGTREKIVVA